MACDCIAKFNKMLAENTGDEKASVDIAYIINRQTGKMSEVVSMTCSYRAKKKDGSLSQKGQTHPISGDYCPFCGKAYSPEEVNDEHPA